MIGISPAEAKGECRERRAVSIKKEGALCAVFSDRERLWEEKARSVNGRLEDIIE